MPNWLSNLMQIDWVKKNGSFFTWFLRFSCGSACGRIQNTQFLSTNCRVLIVSFVWWRKEISLERSKWYFLALNWDFGIFSCIFVYSLWFFYQILFRSCKKNHFKVTSNFHNFVSKVVFLFTEISPTNRLQFS